MYSKTLHAVEFSYFEKPTDELCNGGVHGINQFSLSLSSGKYAVTELGKLREPYNTVREAAMIIPPFSTPPPHPPMPLAGCGNRIQCTQKK